MTTKHRAEVLADERKTISFCDNPNTEPTEWAIKAEEMRRTIPALEAEIKALKAVGEPVAWTSEKELSKKNGQPLLVFPHKHDADEDSYYHFRVPLYLHPKKTLSQSEIMEVILETLGKPDDVEELYRSIRLADAILKKAGEK